MSLIPTWVHEGIQNSLHPKLKMSVTPTRYPCTYAYDFVRSHRLVFGLPDDHEGSRGLTGKWIREKLEIPLDPAERTESQKFLLEMVLSKLADAYIEEWDLVWER